MVLHINYQQPLIQLVNESTLYVQNVSVPDKMFIQVLEVNRIFYNIPLCVTKFSDFSIMSGMENLINYLQSVL